MTTTLIIIAIVFIANFYRIYSQNNQVPKLGVENGALAPISKKPNNVSSQAKVDDKKVATLAFKETPEATMTAIKKAVETYGGATVKEESDSYLYVVFTTSLMKYNDDVEFWLDTENKQVHFRSSSRAGYSDMGLNRKRYDDLAELYIAQ
jgi:uncharacterized protein (DUF1499 family)